MISCLCENRQCPRRFDVWVMHHVVIKGTLDMLVGYILSPFELGVITFRCQCSYVYLPSKYNLQISIFFTYLFEVQLNTISSYSRLSFLNNCDWYNLLIQTVFLQLVRYTLIQRCYCYMFSLGFSWVHWLLLSAFPLISVLAVVYPCLSLSCFLYIFPLVQAQCLVSPGVYFAKNAGLNYYIGEC